MKSADWFLIGVFALFCVYIYAGFYFPDPYLLSYGVNPTRILWFIRIVFPILCLAAIVLYANIRTSKIGRDAVFLLFISTAVSLYVCYGIGDAMYQRWFENHMKQYHPYLQIMPHDDRHTERSMSETTSFFFLGGSTTELADKAGIDWPSRVEKTLRSTYNLHNVEVHNVGRQWYTSLHWLITYETVIRQSKPSVIVIMGAVNDLLQNADFSYMSHGSFREDYGHFYGPVYRIIEHRSLWRYLSDIVRGLWYFKSRRLLTTEFFPGLKAYKNNINTIIELAQHDNTKIVLMTEPYMVKKIMSKDEIAAIGMLKVEAINDTMVWSGETLLNGMQQYNYTLRALAQSDGIFLIDLEKEIPKSLTFFRDEVHYQDTTFSIISSFVSRKLYEFLKDKN